LKNILHTLLYFLLLCCFALPAHSQSPKAQLQGKITNKEGKPLAYASIAILNTQSGAYADSLGNYRFLVPANQNFVCIAQFVGYVPKKIPLRLSKNQVFTLNIRLDADSSNLEEVTVKGNKLPSDRVSIFTIPPKTIKTLPTPFGEFNKILATLPGVVTNSELSSSYSVRGGNFDENLVYVNNIEVYRPFLVRAGQQEGLSFINPDLVQKVEFSAGGWEAKYGDKMSSALVIDYKKPTKWGGSVSWGLLGGTAHIEGVAAQKKLSFVAGVRHKNSQYLLNTLPTSGEYLPRFTDVQALFTYRFSPNTSLEWLTAYAKNNYLVRPAARQTTFGTLDKPFRLLVAFDGQETMQYSLFQNALKLTHYFGKRLRTEWLVSGMNTREREFVDVEGGYRLCDIVPDPTTNTNRCVQERSIGTIYENARNRLQATIISAASRNTWNIDDNHFFEFGGRYNSENINDVLDEYSFIDSAGFTSLNESVNNRLELRSHRFSGYLQHSFNIKEVHTINYGVRVGYWNINQEWIVSPRLQYAFTPNWRKPTAFKLSIGVYQQPPFYRELRDRSGNLNLDLKAQQSLHLIGGVERSFEIGERKFKWTAEAYYKYIQNVIPYDVDNVRIRYFAQNNATAFATGLDLRISGDFVKGAESWFSLGLMNVREDIEGDGVGYIRRPTDQRLTFAAYFEDHLPNNPTFRAYVNMVYGTGLPFGPPNNEKFRAALNGRAYRRIDIGFSKVVSFDNIQIGNARVLKSLWIGLEILNILATENTISYNWITDTNSMQYAIPNTLSTRFVNLRLIGNF
jgi:hypothetical protein